MRTEEWDEVLERLSHREEARLSGVTNLGQGGHFVKDTMTVGCRLCIAEF